MKYILNHITYILEKVTDTRIICDNCGWNWAIVDGGDDLYVCHKCNHDNELVDALK
jgi:DNA-directed RNA polymerase subunit RPC12/RpoP